MSAMMLTMLPPCSCMYCVYTSRATGIHVIQQQTRAAPARAVVLKVDRKMLLGCCSLKKPPVRLLRTTLQSTVSEQGFGCNCGGKRYRIPALGADDEVEQC